MVETNRKKYIISLFITVFGLFTLVSGTSYAILRGNTVSTNEQVIRAGSVEVQLTESFNTLETGASILKDTEGLQQETVYEFTVKNIGSVAAKYDLNLTNTAPSGQTALSDEYIRIGLEVNGQEMGPMGLSNVNNVIDSNTINENEIIRYKMRVWLDKSKKTQIQSNSTKKAYLKLNIEAKQAEYTPKPINYVYRIGEDSARTVYNSQPLAAGTYTGYCGIGTENNEIVYNSCTDDNLGFLSEAACNNYMVVGVDETASCSQGTWTISENIPYSDNTLSLGNDPFYLRYELGNQTEPVKSYACYILNNNEYCLLGGDGVYDSTLDSFVSPSYNDNKTILNDSFGSSNCTDETDSYECTSGLLIVSANSDGSVNTQKGRSFCTVNSTGSSNCDV